MRHLKSGRQLGRNSSHRKAMFRNMVVSLLNHESITTTDAKAKELRRYAEKAITLGKRGTIHARRRARVIVDDREALKKLFTVLAERYKERPGGYTRIIKLGMRPGDNAPLSMIQLVQEEMKPAGKKKKVKTQEAAPIEAAPEEVAEAEEETEAAPEEEEKVETAESAEVAPAVEEELKVEEKSEETEVKAEAASEEPAEVEEPAGEEEKEVEKEEK